MTAVGREGQGRLFAAAAALLVLNLADGVFTLTFLQLGIAQEANPLMRLAYESSPLGFMLLKLSIVHGGIGLLWLHRSSSAGRLALHAGVLLYAAIVAYHCTFLLMLALR